MFSQGCRDYCPPKPIDDKDVPPLGAAKRWQRGLPMNTTQQRSTLAVASLATLATFLDTSLLYVAFPAITSTYGETSATTLSWVLNGYTIVFAALLIPAGQYADRLGHRRVFLQGSAFFTAASIACGLAPTAEMLILFRVLQAVGAAALIPSSLALIIGAFDHAALPRAVAIWGAASAVAGSIGPTLGALLIEGMGWRWGFFINLPVGVYTLIAGRRTLVESTVEDSTVASPVGIALVVVAATTLSFSIVQTESTGWLTGRTVFFLLLGLLVTGAFISHQSRTKSPVLDLNLFTIQNFRWANIAMIVFGTAFSALFFGSILFLTDVWGWSVLAAGFGIAPGPAIVAIVAPRAGKLAGRIGQRPILIAGGALFAASGLHRVFFLTSTTNYVTDWLPSMVLSGIGVGCVFPQLASVAAQALPPHRRGVGGAAVQSARQLGGTFGVAITIALVNDRSSDLLSRYGRVWWVITVGGLLAAAAAVPLRTHITRSEPLAHSSQPQG